MPSSSSLSLSLSLTVKSKKMMIYKLIVDIVISYQVLRVSYVYGNKWFEFLNISKPFYSNRNLGYVFADPWSGPTCTIYP